MFPLCEESVVKHCIGPFYEENGEPITDLYTISNLLPKQFESAFSVPNLDKQIYDVTSLFTVDVGLHNNISDIIIDEITISEAIKELTISSAPGPMVYRHQLLSYMLRVSCQTTEDIF